MMTIPMTFGRRLSCVFLLAGILFGAQLAAASNGNAAASNASTVSDDYAPIADLLFGGLALQVLIVANELQVVDLLADSPLTSAEAAAKLSLEPDRAATLLTALAAIGLLERDARARYAPTPVARRFLGADAEDSLRPIVESFKSMGRMTPEMLLQALRRRAQPPPAAHNEAPPDAAVLKREFAAMHATSWSPGLALARQVDLSNAAEVLDIGGGSGAIAIRLAHANPRLRATITELKDRTQFPLEYVTRHGVADRVRVVGADMFSDPFPGRADVVLFSQILHNWTDQQNDDLMAKSFAYLPRGGRLLVHEALLNDDRTGPRFAALQNLLMGLTAGSRQYTGAELRTLAERVGFVFVSTEPTAGGFSISVFRKP